MKSPDQGEVPYHLLIICIGPVVDISHKWVAISPSRTKQDTKQHLPQVALLQEAEQRSQLVNHNLLQDIRGREDREVVRPLNPTSNKRTFNFVLSTVEA